MTWPPAILCGCLALSLAAEAQVAAPVFVPLDADGITPFAVTVSSPTPGAQIRYTLNGADPLLTDLPITSGGSITLNRKVTIKAKAWLGVEESPVTTSTYSVTGDIAAGQLHSLSLAWASEVNAWGNQANGRLGNGLTSGNALTPGASKYSANSNIADAIGIAAGTGHSIFLRWDPSLSGDARSTVWGFGFNTSGQLGNNATATTQAYPVQTLKSTAANDFLTGVTEVSAGENFSAAVMTDGRVFTWGTRSNGRLGDGSTSGTRRFANPVKRGDGAFPDLTGIVSVRAGGGFALARTSTTSPDPGRVWAWGLNSSGQLGRGNTTTLSRAMPVLLTASPLVELTDVIDVSAGESHSAVLRWKESGPAINGEVWCFGQRSFGRLGNGNTSSTSTAVPLPTRVETAAGIPLQNIVSVAAGSAHTLALDAGDLPGSGGSSTSGGYVWAWGNNSVGAIGDSTNTHRGYAVKVRTPAGVVNPDGSEFLQNIVRIAAGGTGTNGFSLAVAADGTVYGWGRNGNGQLGHNSTSNVNRPVVIPNFKLRPGYPETDLAALVAPSAAPGTVLLTASPSDPDGAGTISNIKFYVNATLVSDGTSLTHSYVPAAAGSYHAFALVTDNTGIQAQSPPVNFSISAPQVSLAVQVAPALAPGHVILKATPTDADGPGNLSLVKFYIGGVEVGQGTAPHWEFGYVPSQPGSFLATAKVIDAFGLEGNSAAVPFSVHAPQLLISGTTIVHETPGFFTIDAVPSDADGAGNLSHVNLFLNGSFIGSTTDPWSYDLQGLAAGTHNLNGVAVDRFGLTGSSNTLQITIYPDQGAPDGDADGLPDWWEDLYGLNPGDPSDAAQDWYGDGTSNLVKYQTGRNPLVAMLPDTTGATGLILHTPLD